MTKETEFLLSQWALWSRINSGKAKGYPIRSAFVEPSYCDDLAITDKVGMLIDEAMSLLMKRDRGIGNATALFYFYNQNMTRTAERLETSRNTARRWVEAGTAWIDGLLYDGDN